MSAYYIQATESKAIQNGNNASRLRSRESSVALRQKVLIGTGVQHQLICVHERMEDAAGNGEIRPVAA